VRRDWSVRRVRFWNGMYYGMVMALLVVLWDVFENDLSIYKAMQDIPQLGVPLYVISLQILTEI
jgi:hypothetical protein